ncbi:hypothetical protein [Candidatus Palauibacter sp.]|uniref:hypothetical protein n=1 Tax=Candidatus Palauibacter sp. TaxID=3101350 RepID=UPI003B5BB2DE
MANEVSVESTAGGRFESILTNFEYSLQGYRLFLAQLHGQIKDSYQGELEARMGRIVDKLEPKDRDSVVEGFDSFIEFVGSSIEEETAAKGDENESDKSGFSVEFSSESSSRAFAKMFEFIMRAGWIGPDAQLERLYRSVIIGLVGQFEVLIADIAHQFFKCAPQALDADEKVLSLSDLQDFGSVEAALDYLVEREIDKLLAQPVQGWAKFFDSRMDIQLRRMAWDWGIFKEIIQRRHIIVHTDGRISRRYLQYVSPELVKEYFGEEAKIGQTTRLDRDYVETALDHLESLGTLLCCTAWVKLDKQSLDQFEDTLSAWIYDQLLEGRWTMALTMAQEGENSKKLSHSTQLVCRANAWLCLKRIGRFDEVKEEVEEFDDSALENRFRFARLAILDREEELCDLLEANEGGGLDHQAWHEWPIFSEIRENPRFAELAERFGPKPKSTVADDSPGEAA